jgi:hypothetical protein
LGGQIEQTDSALGLCAAIGQSHEFDSCHHRLGLLGVASRELGSVYRVIASFLCLTHGVTFEGGRAGRWQSDRQRHDAQVDDGAALHRAGGAGGGVMASMRSLQRLYQEQSRQRERERIKCPKFGQLQIDVSGRRRLFRSCGSGGPRSVRKRRIFRSAIRRAPENPTLELM